MWEEMDIISALGIKTGHSLVVSKIFSFLEPIDLINVTLVSEQWKQLCYFDRASSRRLRKFTAKRKRQKENFSALGKKPRKEIEYKGNTPIPISPSRIRFNLFVQEALKLNKTGKLTTCPRCTLPAKVNDEENGATCTREACSFHFCLRCQCAYHKGTNCKYCITSSPTSSPSKAARYTACTRQSKKALRRLCI